MTPCIRYIIIDEGITKPRSWEVTLSTPHEARAEKKADTLRQRLLDAAAEFPQGETKTAILDTAKLKSDCSTRLVFDSLVNEGRLVPHKVRKHSATHDGFRLPTETLKAAS